MGLKMIFDLKSKTIQLKVVYYGPAMSGKTTSIRYLFSSFGKEENLESIESTIGRTLFFDFGVLEFKGSEWLVKFLLYSATGQDFYASTRPSTLQGVDGIIFIMDSQYERLKHNENSWNELSSLFGVEIYDIPIVFSINKCDLNGEKKKVSLEDLNSFIQFERFNNYYINKTIATSGEGILDAFKTLIKFVFPQLTLNCKSC
ncbi:MAG: hypothetical protein EU550_01885 [Promethearchaeota archaeon]|nr:MAG: hypothetical protein EU550_01885 [Candidatus Lokiarchaeota archaeon]